MIILIASLLGSKSGEKFAGQLLERLSKKGIRGKHIKDNNLITDSLIKELEEKELQELEKATEVNEKSAGVSFFQSQDSNPEQASNPEQTSVKPKKAENLVSEKPSSWVLAELRSKLQKRREQLLKEIDDYQSNEILCITDPALFCTEIPEFKNTEVMKICIGIDADTCLARYVEEIYRFKSNAELANSIIHFIKYYKELNSEIKKFGKSGADLILHDTWKSTDDIDKAIAKFESMQALVESQAPNKMSI